MNPQPQPDGHDYRVGELVTMREQVGPLDAGDVAQVVGFKGGKLRVKPVGGIPVLARRDQVLETGLAGATKTPRRRFRPQRRRLAAT